MRSTSTWARSPNTTTFPRSDLVNLINIILHHIMPRLAPVSVRYLQFRKYTCMKQMRPVVVSTVPYHTYHAPDLDYACIKQSSAFVTSTLQTWKGSFRFEKIHAARSAYCHAALPIHHHPRTQLWPQHSR